eukprot:3364301-Pyramimonas_sp.AAC.1
MISLVRTLHILAGWPFAITLRPAARGDLGAAEFLQSTPAPTFEGTSPRRLLGRVRPDRGTPSEYLPDGAPTK